MVDELKQARKKNLKKSIDDTTMRPRSTMKGEIRRCIELFMNLAKFLIESGKIAYPTNELMFYEGRNWYSQQHGGRWGGHTFLSDRDGGPWKRCQAYAVVTGARGSTIDVAEQTSWQDWIEYAIVVVHFLFSLMMSLFGLDCLFDFLICTFNWTLNSVSDSFCCLYDMITLFLWHTRNSHLIATFVVIMCCPFRCCTDIMGDIKDLIIFFIMEFIV